VELAVLAAQVDAGGVEVVEQVAIKPPAEDRPVDDPTRSGRLCAT
jgi:hypothetical protein